MEEEVVLVLRLVYHAILVQILFEQVELIPKESEPCLCSHRVRVEDLLSAPNE